LVAKYDSHAKERSIRSLILFFCRNPLSCELKPTGFINDVGGIDVMTDVAKVAISPDNKFIYATSSDASVALFAEPKQRATK